MVRLPTPNSLSLSRLFMDQTDEHRVLRNTLSKNMSSKQQRMQGRCSYTSKITSLWGVEDTQCGAAATGRRLQGQTVDSGLSFSQRLASWAKLGVCCFALSNHTKWMECRFCEKSLTVKRCDPVLCLRTGCGLVLSRPTTLNGAFLREELLDSSKNFSVDPRLLDHLDYLRRAIQISDVF